MAYTPTNWQTGDVITAEKLNKAEQGIDAAYPYIVGIAGYDEETSDMILDKTWSEVNTAMRAGRIVFILSDEYSVQHANIFECSSSNNLYYATARLGDQYWHFKADNESDYLKQYPYGD